MLNVMSTTSYDGSTVGVYTRKVLKPDDTVDTATSGVFSMDVSLMANFGGDDVAARKGSPSLDTPRTT